jgi:DNA helicase IV
MDEIEEKIYLDYVKENIELKAQEITENKSLTGYLAASNKDSIQVKKHFENLRLPNPQSPYFVRVDLSSGEILYFGHAILSKAKNASDLPQSHKRISHFLTYSRNSDAAGRSVLPLDSFHGEVTRRIRFSIKNGLITSYAEEFSSDQPKATEEKAIAASQVYEAMQETRLDRVNLIKSTLQPDQFNILRLGTDQLLAIQGPPGSGKTVVLLERLSYIAFSNKKLKDEEMMLIGPNKEFLEYVSDAFVTLGYPNIIVSTVEELVRWRINIPSDPPKVEMIKGAIQMQDVLALAVHDLPRYTNTIFEFEYRNAKVNFTPLDSFELLSKLKDLNLPYSQLQASGTVQILNLITERIGVQINKVYGPSFRLTEDPGLLIEKSLPFRQLIRSIFPDHSAESVLNTIRTNLAKFLEYSSSILDEDQQREWISHESLKKPSEFSKSDIPLLDYLESMIKGPTSEKWGHIAIDEVQDLTPMELGMLSRRINSNRTFTITGDLAQATGAIYYESWDVITSFLSEDEMLFREMTTSYRVPSEILIYAQKFLEYTEVDVKKVLPFASLADSLHLETIPSDELIEKRVDELIIENLLNAHSVLLIAPEKMIEHYSSIDFESTGDAHFKAYSPQQVKGLEFDTVIIVRPFEILREGDYKRGQDARVLYVLSTRSTKKLYVLGVDEHEVTDPILKYRKELDLDI